MKEDAIGTGAYACATLITTDSYLPGAVVLAHSLRAHGWAHETVALVTPGVGAPVREALAERWDRVVEIETIVNPAPEEERWLGYFEDMYAKLRIWTMEEYDKIVYLDSDVLVTGPLDEMLERPRFAAAPCGTLPDTFNAGVLVLEPDAATFADMTDKVGTLPSHDGSDQGFLNSYFSDWFTGPPEHRLPTIFNVPQTLYLAGNAWNKIRPDMRVLHFVSPAKPWRRRWARWSRAGYRASARWAHGAGGPTPVDLWRAAWEEATGPAAEAP